MARTGVHPETDSGPGSSGHLSMTRLRLTLWGQVQGVGFRPHVLRLACSLGLSGFVLNDFQGVTLEVQGAETVLSEFEEKLVRSKPFLSRIDRVRKERTGVLREETGFSIRILPGPSLDGPDGCAGDEREWSSLLPDTAVCPECVSELFDPDSRRYRYPLISCTNCGPRFSIALDPPFDRCRTTLRDFPLCPDCQDEFRDPENRRFHSQTIGCPRCGPKTRLLEGAGNPELTEDPVRRALMILLSGGVLAIKGTGGYHLACDAMNREAIGRIRAIKNRPEKPLAVMAGSLADLGLIARISSREGTLLESPERPIVLLPMKESGDFPYDLIAPGLDRIGLFLPSTPIQHLLFDPGQEHPLALVMTSANLAGWPITALEAEVLEQFSGKTDGFLVHDRPVFHRLDDSLVLSEEKGPILLRRSRGWVPSVFSVGRSVRSRMDILAMGGHLNVAPCRIRDGQALVLPHLGDLDGAGVREAYRTFLQRVVLAEGGAPTHLACDLHPDFASTGMAFEWGRDLGIPVVPVQHHHAHIASVMADRGLSGPVLGLALDGFGLGTDGTPWGGELLVVDTLECRRLGHFRPLPLPGGDRVAREPWRMGVAALSSLGRGEEASGIFSSPHVPALVTALEKPGRSLFQSTTSAGRLFDAAYALLGGKDSLSYEGQGAMEMEGWARKAGRGHLGEQLSKTAENWSPDEEGYRLSGEGILDFLPLLGRLVGVREKEMGASLFHGTLALGLRDWILWAREQTGIGTVLLAGGVFQNRILADSLRGLLERADIRVVEPLRVPVNDGGLALGQAWVVQARVLYGQGDPGDWKEI